ncbi:hypothetical protein F3Y22_tig00112507pilonHSYRG00140 [Hibiscus syriacus]|uniref:Uncharacterized protein n=1 Tax=Hibiscus syriacus TaxID=106335 RepID=A0A6A2XVV4_HIBSY|nr:hypothetical protein F3Y22_tig00112507pilonHSYRG00140 [Hibiscus syriacus]
MSTQTLDAPTGRAVGGAENSWCQAVLSGTGIAVLAILTCRIPDVSRLRKALHKLKNSHPVLRSRLHSTPTSNTFSFVTSPSPFFQIKSFNHSATSSILKNLYGQENRNVTPLHSILEHELNQNSWIGSCKSKTKNDLFFVSAYALPGAKEEMEMMVNKGEVSWAIEDLIPKGKAKKTLLARGIDMPDYSVNSFKLTNLKFKDAKSPRSTQVVRFFINPDDTRSILAVSNLNLT